MGYAVASLYNIIEAQPLPPSTSAQQAEIMALILGQGKRIDICIDSKYAFLALHAYAAIWKERGLLTVRNSPIRQGPEILNLSEAVKFPEQVAVMHCKGLQKDMCPTSQGNKSADQETKKTALRTAKQLA